MIRQSSNPRTTDGIKVSQWTELLTPRFEMNQISQVRTRRHAHYAYASKQHRVVRTRRHAHYAYASKQHRWCEHDGMRIMLLRANNTGGANTAVSSLLMRANNTGWCEHDDMRIKYYYYHY